MRYQKRIKKITKRVNKLVGERTEYCVCGKHNIVREFSQKNADSMLCILNEFFPPYILKWLRVKINQDKIIFSKIKLHWRISISFLIPKDETLLTLKAHFSADENGATDISTSIKDEVFDVSNERYWCDEVIKYWKTWRG